MPSLGPPYNQSPPLCPPPLHSLTAREQDGCVRERRLVYWLASFSPSFASPPPATGVYLQGNKVVVYVNGDAETEQAVEIALDAWHHVALVADVLPSGGRLKVYLDGVPVLENDGDGVDFLKFDPYPQHFQVSCVYTGELAGQSTERKEYIPGEGTDRRLRGKSIYLEGGPIDD
eukprot:1004114-Prorocentrum_minimum.AAC.4